MASGGSEFAPLHGRPYSIDRQSDGWVLLKDGYGIREDGSLWSWVLTGTGRAEFFDAGPWSWVSAIPNGSAVGIKSDGTMWTWNTDKQRGDGVIPFTANDVSSNSSRLWNGNPDSISTRDRRRVRIDCAIDRVTVSEGKVYSPSNLEVSLSNYEINDGGTEATFVPSIPSATVWFVQVTSGGSGYTSPPTVTFSPAGATAIAVVSDGAVTFIRVTEGGSYNNQAPTVTISGGGGNGCVAVAHVEGQISVAVSDGGSGYTKTSRPRYWDSDGYARLLHPLSLYRVRAKCERPPSGIVGSLYSVGLVNKGGGYFAPEPPQVLFSGPGTGATAVASVDQNGFVTEISITNGGSGYKEASAPDVTFSGTGNNAAAKATVNALGEVIGVRIVNPGRGYDSGTTVSFDPPGAEAEPVIDDGRIVRVKVVNRGSGYFKASPPKVNFLPAGAEAVATVNENTFAVESITLTSLGKYMAPCPPIATITNAGSGTGAKIGCSVDASGALDSVWIESPGSGYTAQFGPNVSFSPKAGAVGSGGSAYAAIISANRYVQGGDIGEATLAPGGVHSVSLGGPLSLGVGSYALGGSAGEITLESSRKPAPLVSTRQRVSSFSFNIFVEDVIASPTLSSPAVVVGGVGFEHISGSVYFLPTFGGHYVRLDFSTTSPEVEPTIEAVPPSTGTGAVVGEVIFEEHPSGRWKVASVEMSGGSGYTDGDAVGLSLISPPIGPPFDYPSAIARTRRDEPELILYADSYGYGSLFAPSLLEQADANGDKYWKVSSVTVLNGGQFYSVGDSIFAELVSGQSNGMPFAASVSQVSPSGEIQGVIVSQGGGFWKDSGVIDSVKITNAGRVSTRQPPAEWGGSLPEITVTGIKDGNGNNVTVNVSVTRTANDVDYEYIPPGSASGTVEKKSFAYPQSGGISYTSQSVSTIAISSTFTFKHSGSTGHSLRPFETIIRKEKSRTTSVNAVNALGIQAVARDERERRNSTFAISEVSGLPDEGITRDSFGRIKVTPGAPTGAVSGPDDAEATFDVLSSAPWTIPQGCTVEGVNIVATSAFLTYPFTNLLRQHNAGEIEIIKQPEFKTVDGPSGSILVLEEMGELRAKCKYYEMEEVNSDGLRYRVYTTAMNFVLSGTISLSADWYTALVETFPASGYHVPECVAAPVRVFASPDSEIESGKATPATISATVASNDNGTATVTGLSVENAGSGYTVEPTIKIGSAQHTYLGGGLSVDDRLVPKQVLGDVAWKSVEFLDNDLAIAVSQSGNVYWWGDSYSFFTRPWWYWDSYRYPGPRITRPIRFGSSARVEVSDEVPNDRVDGLWSVAGPLISPPDNGIPTRGVVVLEDNAVGVFSENKGYAVHRSFSPPAASTLGASFGYTSAPSLTQFNMDGSNLFGMSATLWGPDGNAERVLRSSSGITILCNDGSLWNWFEASEAFTPTPGLVCLPKTKTIRTMTTTQEGTSWGKFSTPWATINSTYMTILESKDSTRYLVSVASGGSGYRMNDKATVTGEVYFSGDQPPATSAVSGDEVNLASGRNPKPGLTGYDGYYLGERVRTDGEGETQYLTFKTHSQQSPEILTHTIDVEVDGDAYGTSGLFHCEFPPLLFSGEPSVRTDSLFGTGATFVVDEIGEGDRIFSGGWRKDGGRWLSVVRPHLGITTDGEVRTGIGRTSLPVPESLRTIELLASPDRSGSNGLYSGSNSDGSIWVTNGDSLRIQNELELIVTDSGSGLTMPPEATVSGQPDRIATAEAEIDGKVVAVGVIDRGSGYTQKPEVTIDGDATAEAHICGGIRDPVVTAEGSGYACVPKVSVSRPGIPAKIAPTVSGFVSGITLSDGGSRYATPPEVTIVGDGTGATATATISGYVEEILITSPGSGYETAPGVTVSGGGGSGCKAVAEIKHGQLSGIFVTDQGTGYSSSPSVSFSGGNPAVNATAKATLNASVVGLTLGGGGAGYSRVPEVHFSPTSATAFCDVNLSVKSAKTTNPGRYFNNPPTATVSTDWSVNSITLADGGGGYQHDPEVVIVGGSGSGASASCRIHGPVSNIEVKQGGFGYTDDFPPYVAVTGGLDPETGVHAKASATVSAGVVSSISIDSPGNGYRSPPTVSFRWPESASAVATIEGGRVVEVTLVNTGAFYPVAPRVEFMGGDCKTPAKATATVTDGSVASIQIVDGGEKYLSAPDVYLTYDSYGEGAEARSEIDGVVDEIYLTKRGSGYVLPPERVLFIGGGGDGAEAELTVSQFGSGASLECTLNGRVEYIELKSHGSNYQYPPTVTIEPPGLPDGRTAEAQARILGPITGISVTNFGNYSKTEEPYTGGTVSAVVDGIGYARYFADEAEPISFALNQQGGLTDLPTSWPHRTYIQKPSIHFGDALFVKPLSSLALAAWGVDHVGDSRTESRRAVSSVEIPLSVNQQAFADDGSRNLAAVSANEAVSRRKVASIFVTESGEGYLSPPSVSVSGRPATAVLSDGRVSSVSLDDSTYFFTETPTVAFSGGSPSAEAAAIAIMEQPTDWTVAEIRLTDAGEGYQSPPTVTVSPGPCTASVQMDGQRVRAVSVIQNGYYATPPAVSFSGGNPTRPATAEAVLRYSLIDSELFDADAKLVWRGSLRSSSFRIGEALHTLISEDYAGTSMILENERGHGASVSFENLDSDIRVTISGGQDYSTRYENSDPCLTINNAVSLAYYDGAAATASVSDGFVTSITVDDGGTWAYKSQPVVYISGGGGSGAVATAIVTDKTISSIRIDSQGSGYTSPPLVTIVDKYPYQETIVIDNLYADTSSRPLVRPMLRGGSVLDFAEPARDRRPYDFERVGMFAAFGLATPTAGVSFSSDKVIIHPFFDQGSVVDARITHGEESSRMARALYCQHSSPPVVSFLVSGTSTPSGFVERIDVVDGGEGYSSAPDVSVSGNCTARAVMLGGSVASVEVTARGSGYTTPPSVSFSGGGSPAKAASATAYILPIVPAAQMSIAKWHPPVADGAAVRDMA